MTQSAAVAGAPAVPLAGEAAVGEHWTELDGVRMRWLQAGCGPALLLLHGLMGYSFSWRHNISALARQTTVYALDLPGAGYSSRARVDCSLRGMARLVLRFMEAQGLASADVLGTSYGGALAMRMAVEDAEQNRSRVRSLVLVAPVNPWSRAGRKRVAVLGSRLGGACARWVLPFLIGPAQRQGVRRMYGDRDRISPGTVEGYAAPLSQPGTVEHLLRILRCWKRDLNELEAALPRIAHVPTLLVWGTRDTAVPASSAAGLQAAFRENRLALLEGAGHLPYEEVPGEFNAAVIQWLRQRSSI